MSSSHSSVCVTLQGLPIHIELHWPFHQSGSGADFYVLHGNVRLEDSSGLEAEVAANVTQTIAAALPSLEPEHAESLIVNAIRKTLDNGQLELQKSGKLQPVQISSRYLRFATRKIQFATQPESAVTALLKRKVYWLGVRLGQTKVWIQDPRDGQYVNLSEESLLALARGLESQGLIALTGEYAAATDSLRRQEQLYEHELRQGLARLKVQFNAAMTSPGTS